MHQAEREKEREKNIFYYAKDLYACQARPNDCAMLSSNMCKTDVYLLALLACMYLYEHAQKMFTHEREREGGGGGGERVNSLNLRLPA